MVEGAEQCAGLDYWFVISLVVVLFAYSDITGVNSLMGKGQSLHLGSARGVANKEMNNGIHNMWLNILLISSFVIAVGALVAVLILGFTNQTSKGK